MPSNSIVCNLDYSYLDLLTKIDFCPIFIMGIHRSGTTLLHEILVATQCFNYVSSYHVVNYNELLYNSVNQTENQARQKVRELFESLGIVTRGFDNLERTIDSTVEYGFILRNTGYKKYLNSENLHQFIEICRKVQFISKVDRPILLKNPWCFPHFMFIKSTFPDAKFIFIHREPIHVINSRLKLTRSIWSKKNMYLVVIWEKYIQTFDNPLQRSYWWLLNSEYFDMGVRRTTKRHVEWTTYLLQNIGSLGSALPVMLKLSTETL